MRGFAIAALLLAAPPAAAQCELDKVRAGDADASDHFGFAVAVDGDCALIGAIGDDELAADAGAGYVFERQATAWVETAKLLAAGGGPQDGLGHQVALDGTRAAVGGSPSQDDVGVLVFERSPSGWVETAALLPDGPSAGTLFGASLALAGDTLVVGAPAAADQGFGSGAAYVFERSGTAWVQTAKLLASDGVDGDRLGSAVGIGDGFVAVGAPGSDVASQSSGAVYVYERDGTGWTQSAKLFVAAPAVGEGLGSALDAGGTRVLAGAPGASACYVFDRQGAGWSASKLAPAAAAFAFGASVALDGNTALVGEGASVPGAGSAFVFERAGSAWSEAAELTAVDDDGIFNGFARSVALAGDVAAVGSWGDGDGAQASGSAYLWSVSDTGCPSLFAAPDLLSLNGGGSQFLRLNAGPDRAGELHLVLGSAAGTSPGVMVGGLTLPLVVDGYYLFLLLQPNTLVQGSLGLLDGSGEALAELVLPAGTDPGLAGLTLHHAYVTLDPLALPLALTSASIAQPLTLVP